MFWKFLLFFVIGIVTSLLLVGMFVLLGALIWYIVRSVTGMQTLSKGDAIAKPGSWGFTA